MKKIILLLALGVLMAACYLPPRKVVNKQINKYSAYEQDYYYESDNYYPTGRYRVKYDRFGNYEIKEYCRRFNNDCYWR